MIRHLVEREINEHGLIDKRPAARGRRRSVTVNLAESPLAWLSARGKLDTRHYAKRQFTFARHQLPDFTWLSAGDPWAAVEAACISRM